jgi:hypothetical protein
MNYFNKMEIYLVVLLALFVFNAFFLFIQFLYLLLCLYVFSCLQCGDIPKKQSFGSCFF